MIDIDTLEIYDIDGEVFGGRKHHTLRGLDVEGIGETEQGEINNLYFAD